MLTHGCDGGLNSGAFTHVSTQLGSQGEGFQCVERQVGQPTLDRLFHITFDMDHILGVHHFPGGPVLHFHPSG